MDIVKIKKAKEYFIEASEALENGKDWLVLCSIHSALTHDETNPEYYCFLGDFFIDNWKRLDMDQKSDNIKYLPQIIKMFDKLKLDGFEAECYFIRGLANSTFAKWGSFFSSDSKDEKIIKEREYYSFALNDFSKAISIDGSKDKYYNERGSLYNLLKRHNDALADFNKAIQINELNSKSYAYMGRVYDNIGDKELAFEKYLYALHLDNSVSDYYNSLANLIREDNEMPTEEEYMNDYGKLQQYLNILGLEYQCRIRGRELEDNPVMLKMTNSIIEKLYDQIKSWSEHIDLLANQEQESEDDEYYEQEDDYDEQEDDDGQDKTLFGKFMNVVKSGLSEVGNAYNKKLDKIEKYKERHKYKSRDELREIISSSSVFEEKVAAKQLLEES